MHYGFAEPQAWLQGFCNCSETAQNPKASHTDSQVVMKVQVHLTQKAGRSQNKVSSQIRQMYPRRGYVDIHQTVDRASWMDPRKLSNNLNHMSTGILNFPRCCNSLYSRALVYGKEKEIKEQVTERMLGWNTSHYLPNFRRTCFFLPGNLPTIASWHLSHCQ